MNNYRETINTEFDKWKKTPPNAVQRGTGVITKPIEYLLKPFINKVTPLFEGVFKDANSYISSALKNKADDIVDIKDLSEEQFEQWLDECDIKSKDIVSAGITSLSAEGGLTGLGGFALLAIDIPASFGLILGFANKIALTYQLDITEEDIQIEILKAISVGSETTLEGKTSAIATLKSSSNIINTHTWKSIGQVTKSALPNVMSAIRIFLRKLGVNVTRRKAAQLIPVLGAVSGAVINGAWSSDALEAVRQYARKNIADNYYKDDATGLD